MKTWPIVQGTAFFAGLTVSGGGQEGAGTVENLFLQGDYLSNNAEEY